MAAAACYQQVLELVLPAMTDLPTLAVCSVLSAHFHQYVKSTVQLHLATLVRLSNYPFATGHGRKQLGWLCSTAGPQAVNTHAVGCALLETIMQDYGAPGIYIQLLNETGLVMTNTLLVHLAQKHMHAVADLLLAIKVEDTQLDPVYLQFGRCANDAQDEDRLAPQDLSALLCAINGSNLPDLLHITCNNLELDETRAQAAAELLLDFDRTQVHILHTGHTSGVGASSNTGPAHHTSSGQVNSGTQPTGRQHDPQQLVVSLLETCILRGNAHIVARLVDTPVAQGLGTEVVIRLFLSAHRQGTHHYDGPEPCPMASLASLPGAKVASADCIAALVRSSIHQRSALHMVPLLQLPNAKRIGSKQLCELVAAAGRANMLDTVYDLGRLANGRQLEADHVVALLKQCINDPWSPERFFDHDLDAMDSLDPGRHLSGDNVLELLEFSTITEFRVTAWADICQLTPARDQVQDVGRFVNCLKAVIAVADAGTDRITTVLDCLPIFQQVQPTAWFDVLSRSLKSPMRKIPEGVQQLDAVQQLNPEQVGQLLQLAVEVQAAKSIRVLCTLPAAQQLPVELAGKLLQQLLPALPHEWVLWRQNNSQAIQHFLDVMRLTPSQQMPAAAVHSLMKQAYACSNPLAAWEIQSCCEQVVEAEFVPGADQLLQLLLDTNNIRIADRLLAVPSLQDLTPAGLSRLIVKLLALFHNKAAYDRLEHVPLDLHHWQVPAAALQGMQAIDLLQVVAACLQYHEAGILKQLLALPAAVDFTTAQLLQLLRDDVPVRSFVDVESWQQLLQLPAAQQFGCSSICSLLQCLAKHRACPAGVAGLQMLVGMLLQLPAACHIDAATAANLLEVCMQQDGHMVAAALLSQLPAVKQLSSVQLKGLLQEAIGAGMSHLCSRFSQLAGAAGTDPELNMLIEVLGLVEPVVDAGEAHAYCRCPSCLLFL